MVLLDLHMSNNEKTIPANIIVLFDIVLSILLENNMTKYTVKSPNINPTKGSVKLPMTGIVIPVIITRPAPNDAPDDTPKVYGDAS